MNGAMHARALREQRRACVHEAGHVIMSLLFGINVGMVTINPNGSGSVLHDRCEEPWSFALICAAGMAAEKIIYGVEILPYDDSHNNDIQAINRIKMPPKLMVYIAFISLQFYHLEIQAIADYLVSQMSDGIRSVVVSGSQLDEAGVLPIFKHKPVEIKAMMD